MANVLQKLEVNGLVQRVLRVPVTVTNGASAGTFVLPRGAVVQGIDRDTPVAIPGTPDSVSLRLGSAANGEQYVADADLKAQGYSALTVVYAARNAAAAAPLTVHYTVASSGGTAASQDGSIILYVAYAILP